MFSRFGLISASSRSCSGLKSLLCSSVSLVSEGLSAFIVDSGWEGLSEPS